MGFECGDGFDVTDERIMNYENKHCPERVKKQKNVIKSKEKKGSSLHPSASKDNNARRRENRRGQKREGLRLRGLYVQQQQENPKEGCELF